jgi:hypothetical protein
LLAAVFPVIFLIAVNITQINIYETWRAFLVSLFLGIGLQLLCYLLVRNRFKANLIATTVGFVVLSYGQIYEGLRQFSVILIRHRYFLPAALLFCALIIWIIVRTRRNLYTLTGFLNILFGILVVYSLIPIISDQIMLSKSQRLESATHSNSDNPANQKYPDIYYFVLDSYPRSDVIQEKYKYDNSVFINKIKDLGFFVAECSQSNYSFITYSLSSSLNLAYLSMDPLDQSQDKVSYCTKLARNIIWENKVRRTLEKEGYVTVAFDTGYSFTQWQKADYYFPLKSNDLNSFESMVMDSTIVRVWNDYQLERNPSVEYGQSAQDIEVFTGTPNYYYQINRSIYSQLESIEEIPGPKFVFAHLLGLHGPVVFRQDGTFRGDYPESGVPIINQLIYTNNQMVEISEKLIRTSQVPPVIIIQSDHGNDASDKTIRLKNFIAVYASKEVKAQLYDSLTPVNIYRIIFNVLFDQKNEILPDVSYYLGDPVEVIPGSCPR